MARSSVTAAPAITITLLGGPRGPHLFQRFTILAARRFDPRVSGPRCVVGPYYRAPPPMNQPTRYLLPSHTRALYVYGRSGLGPTYDFHAPLSYAPGEHVRVPLTAPTSPLLRGVRRLEALFREAPWTFARTYAHSNPHHYTRRDDWRDDEAFTWSVAAIQRLGRPEKFNDSWWTVCDVGDHFYWAGWEPPERTGWINRKPLAGPPTRYDVPQTLVADDARLLRIPALPARWHHLPPAFTTSPHFAFGIAMFGDEVQP